MKPGILYISYDGMLEPLGQSQVLAYLEQLAEDYRIYLISFEKAEDFADTAKRAAIRRRIEAAGISWRPLRYHKAPSGPATAYDIAVGTLAALFLALRHRVSMIHARSYVAALMALIVRRITGVGFLFDMRGLWADERVDGGLWPRAGRLYRATKALERRFLLEADHVVTLTQVSAAELRRFTYLQDRCPRITVIPTCADLDRFTPRPTPKDGVFTFGFVGAATSWSLLDEMLACYAIVCEREPQARLLIVNRNEHPYIQERLRHLRINPEAVELVAADHRDVPALISRMTVGAAIRRPVYSQVACAPTKLAEYLGCGVPCLANAGIGDVESIVEGARVGAVLDGFSDAQMRAGVARLLALASEPGIRERCVAAAHRFFSLDDGVARYREVYRATLSCKAARTGGSLK